MREIGLSIVSVGAIGALIVTTLPAQAQFVSIPVTNGNFVITNTAGVNSYTALPTFLSPAGTLTITGANAGSAVYNSPTLVTTNTPVGIVDQGSYAGSATLNDGRTATFTGAGASLRGTATVTGTPSLPVSSVGGIFYSPINLPPGASFTYTVQSGAVHVPTASLSAYPAPQFTIPVSGGSFTLTDPTGTGNATVTINAILTPLGTTNLTFSSPNLSNATPGLPFAFYQTPNLATNLGGLANGTVALNDGRTAIVTDRLTHLTADTQVVTLPPGAYVQGSQLLTTSVTIQGTITGGSISVPELAIASPPALGSEPGQPQSPNQSNPTFVLGFAQILNLGGEPEAYLKIVGLERVPVYPTDLPEVEGSPLAYSRIHPGVNAYNR